MWPWRVMIPSGDFTYVTLAIEDIDDYDDHDDHGDHRDHDDNLNGWTLIKMDENR